MIIGGTQDNGTLCHRPADGSEQWREIFGGAGGFCAAAPTDPNVLYGKYVFLNIQRSTDGGATNDTQGDRYISGQFWHVAIGRRSGSGSIAPCSFEVARATGAR